MIIRFVLLSILVAISNQLIAQCTIIPTPASYEETGGELTFGKQLRITSGQLSKNNLEFLKNQLSDLFSIELLEVKKKGTLQFIQNPKRESGPQEPCCKILPKSYRKRTGLDRYHGKRQRQKRQTCSSHLERSTRFYQGRNFRFAYPHRRCSI